jgi:hypothetical protein
MMGLIQAVEDAIGKKIPVNASLERRFPLEMVCSI